MSKTFGPIVQQGYIVRDLDAAMRFWIERMGVGPFFAVRPVRLVNVWYRGTNISVTMSCAFANSGETQIELIQPFDQPSIYTEFFAARREGLHHVGYLTDEYGKSVAAAQALGFEHLQSGENADSGFAYFDSGDPAQGSLIELIEASAMIRQFFSLVHDAAVGWDGTDPVRLVRPHSVTL
jgi:hypothetical protein